MGIPHDGERIYEPKNWPICWDFDYVIALRFLLGNMELEDIPRKILANQLQVSYRLLHLIVSHNLIPRGGHREESTFMDVFMIDHILKYKVINLPNIMLRLWKRLMGIRTFHNRELDTLAKSKVFNKSMLTRMGYRRTTQGEWVPKRQPSEDEND